MTGPIFDAGAIRATATLDRDQFRRDLRETQADLKRLARDSVKIPVVLDPKQLRSSAAEAKRVVSGMSAAKLDLGLNLAPARRDVTEFKRYVTGLSTAKLSLGASSAEGRKDVAEFRRYIRNLQATDLKIGGDTSKLRRDIEGLKRLGLGTGITVNVDADTLRAMLKMREVDSYRRKLDGSRANISIGADGTRALGVIGLVTAGISGIAYLAPAAGIALAGMLATAGSVGQGIGAIAGGFFGIGAAVKAMTAEEDKSATATAKATKDISSQLRAREDAYRNVTRVGIQSKQQLEDASKSVTDAERSLARAIDQSSQTISNAERNVTRTQRTAIQVQNDLNKARKEAALSNEDLIDSLQSAQLSEEDALLNLTDAQRNLQNAQAAGITGEDLQRIDLAARQAAESYDQAQKNTKRLSNEQQDADKKGIEGSDQVVAAKERIYDANTAVEDAERSLTEARKSGLESVGDAERALDQARIQQARTQEQVQFAQEDAARRVIESQQDLAKALKDTGVAADTAGKKADLAMSKLTPEGRKFVHFLLDEARPAVKAVGDSIQSSMLPGVESGLRRLLQLQPMLQSNLTDTGMIVGRLADEGSRMVASGPWTRDFNTIMSAHNKILTDLGISGFNVADATRSMYVEALPTLQTFFKWLNTSTDLFNQFIQGKRATGELGEFFGMAGDKAKILWDMFVNLVESVYNLGVAWAPVGGTVVDIINGLAGFVTWLTKLNPELVVFLGYAVLTFVAFTNLGKAVTSLGSSIRLAIGGWQKLLTLFLPEVLSSRLGLAATGLGSVSAGTDKTAASSEKAAISSGRFGTAIGKVVKNLPIVGAIALGVGLAHDEMSISVNEATDALKQGGDAAAEMMNKLRESQQAVQDHSFGNWIGWISRQFSLQTPEIDKVNRALDVEYAKSNDLQRAQIQVTLAQDAHTEAIHKWGAGSGAAQASAKVLDLAIEDLAKVQKKAGDETKTHTDRLKDLRSEIMGQIDSNFAFVDSQSRAKDAQDELNRVLAETPRDARAVEEATRALEKAQYDMVVSAGQQAAAVNAGKDATVIAKAEAEAMAGQLVDLATKAGGVLPPQLQILAASLDDNAWKAKGARIETDQFGHAVLVLPSGARVPIDAPGAVEARDRVRELNSALIDAKNSWFAFYQQAQAKPIATTVPQRGTVDNVPGLIPGGTVVRARGGINVLGMAVGGVLPSNIASVVKPSTPVMMGDNQKFDESYIPHDPTSTRAQQIFDATGKALGRNVLPQGATGTVLGDVDAASFTKQLIELREKGLSPLADQVNTTTLPTLNDLNDLSGPTLTKTFLDLSKTIDDTWKTNTTSLAVASTGMQGSIAQLMNSSNSQFTTMQQVIGNQMGTIGNAHLPFMRTAMSTTAVAADNFSNAVAVSFDKMKGYTANPIHWMIDWPFNAGLVRAWNEINGFFALNRPMKPLPQFAKGGAIRGGAPNKDDVLFRGMTGEFVMPKPMVRAFGGIDNLERARVATLGGSTQGPEGMGAGLPGMAVGGAIDKAMAYGKAQVGKPYIWGAVGPNGFDCSGLWSAMQNTLMGRAPNSRLYSASDFSTAHGAAGLLPGLKSAFTVGVQPGHMAGTLAGTAFEATPPRVRMSPSAHGSSQFPMKFFLPEAGGQFIDAPGGGASFDVGAFVREKMTNATNMSNDMRKFFGDALPAVAGQKAMLDMINGLIGWSTANISGGTGTAGANGDVVAQVRAVAARYGWDKGQLWNALSEIVSIESSWDPSAANPESSARGLFQKMTSIHGPVEPTAAGQAEWGLKYIKDRYGDPIAALAFHKAHGYYKYGGEVKAADNGTKLAPNQTVRNASSTDEWIFTDNQLRTVIRSAAKQSSTNAANVSSNGIPSSDAVTTVNLHMSPGTPWQEAMKEAKHIWTHQGRGVHKR